MFSFIKFLKIALPVATVTSATIATTLLVSSSRNDTNNNEQDLDEGLKDFSEVNEDFKDKKLFYAKNGEGKGTTVLSEEESKRIEELMARNVEITDEGARSDTLPENVDSRTQEPNSQPVDNPEPQTPSVSLPRSQADIGQKEPQPQKIDGLDSNKEQTKVVAEKDAPSKPQEIDSDAKKTLNDESANGDDEDSKDLGDEKDPTVESKGNQALNNEVGEGQNSVAVQDESSQKSGEASKLSEEGTSEGSSTQIEANDESTDLAAEDQSQQSLDGESVGKAQSDTPAETSSTTDGDNLQQYPSSGDNNLNGDSNETRVDLQKLQDLQDQLSSTRDALGQILKQISA